VFLFDGFANNMLVFLHNRKNFLIRPGKKSNLKSQGRSLSTLLLKVGHKKQEIVMRFTGSLPAGKGSDEETYARLGNTFRMFWLSS